LNQNRAPIFGFDAFSSREPVSTEPVIGRAFARPVGLKMLSRRAPRNFFMPSVKWITSASSFPGHVWAYRAAQADFNVRGWQGRWRYTAPTALFFYGLWSGLPALPEAARLPAVAAGRMLAGW
jgi:hypothetical protein